MTTEPARNAQTGDQEVASPDDQQPGIASLPTHRVKRTRAGGLWAGLVLAAVILLLLLIFILENGRQVSISYFGARAHSPLGVALLLAAVLGVLIVVIPGTARIIQLRLTARRHRGLDAEAAAAPARLTKSGPGADRRH
jgi:uncharacterized integral membrane protein